NRRGLRSLLLNFYEKRVVRFQVADAPSIHVPLGSQEASIGVRTQVEDDLVYTVIKLLRERGQRLGAPFLAVGRAPYAHVERFLSHDFSDRERQEEGFSGALQFTRRAFPISFYGVFGTQEETQHRRFAPYLLKSGFKKRGIL